MPNLNLLDVNDTAGEHPASYYAATADLLDRQPPLGEDIACDVCIVGAGYTGLSAALHLAEAGLDVVVLEAQRAGWGASGRNGGHVGSGQRLAPDEMEKQFGKAAARRLWDISQGSVALIKSLIASHDIDCEYKPGIIHAAHRQRYVADAREEAETLRHDYGYQHIRFIDTEEMHAMVGAPGYYGGTLDTGAGHLHPLKFALGLARAAIAAGVRIFEQTRVASYDAGPPATVHTAGADVKAEHLVLACNGYLGDLDRQVAARVMPINNFMIATEPLGEAAAKALIRDDVAVSDTRFVVNYFRLSADRRLLFGGGENYGYRFPADIKAFVRRPMLEVYPQLKDIRIDYGWGGTLGITMNRMPHLARLAPNVLSSSGYSGHGVPIATLAGKLVSEAIVATGDSFDTMARVPTPRFPGGPAMRSPLLALAMTWYALRDRI